MAKILVCGVGSLGSNLVSCLVPDLRGQHEITILDKDKVEERNIQAGTQFYTADQIGQNKVEASQYNIYKWYEKEIEIFKGEFEEFLSSKNIGAWDLLIDCFDNYEARDLIQRIANDLGIGSACLHLGLSDQMTFEISWAENYKVPSDITSGWDVCEMEGAASFIKMVSALASSVIQHYLTTGEKKEYIGNRFSIRKIK